MSNEAHLYKGNELFCIVKIHDLKMPRRTFTNVSAGIGSGGRVERIPGKIEPGSVIFECGFEFLEDLSNYSSGFSTWGLVDINNTRLKISIHKISGNLVTASVYEVAQ